MIRFRSKLHLFISKISTRIVLYFNTLRTLAISFLKNPIKHFFRNRSNSIKNLLPKSLYARTVTIIVTPLALMQIFSTYIFFHRHFSDLTDKLSNIAASQITIISHMIDNEKDIIEIEKIATQFPDFYMSFKYGDKVIKKKQKPDIVTQQLIKILNKCIKQKYTLDADEDNIYIQIQKEHGVLNITIMKKNVLSRTAVIFLIWNISLSLLLALIAWLFLKKQIEPILLLSKKMSELGRGIDYGYYKPSGAYEIRKAGKAFNLMKDRLNRFISQRTEILAGISHDLRTPIARMKLQIEFMKDHPEHDAIEKNIMEMEQITESFLEYAKSEKTEYASNTNVISLIKEIISMRSEENIDLHFKDESICIYIKKNFLFRAISNVVDNGVKYADKVMISVTKTTLGIVILIEDNGPGIPPCERNLIFKPFYRCGSSRSSNIPGSGLGLAIAKDSMRCIGGEISVDNSKLGGAQFSIFVPE